MADADVTPRKKFALNWLLWWRVNPDELAEQLVGYDSLSWWRSARKVAVLFLLLSGAMTSIFVASGISDSDGMFSVGIFLILSVFIYRGQRWALWAAMVFWTVEKGLQLTDVGHGGNIVSIILWWTAYMHAFYLALLVERKKGRREEGPSSG